MGEGRKEDVLGEVWCYGLGPTTKPAKRKETFSILSRPKMIFVVIFVLIYVYDLFRVNLSSWNYDSND